MVIIQDTFSESLALLKKERKRRQLLNFSTDELIENQVWEFLFQIGFSKLNIGMGCEIRYGKNMGNLISKKVDVIAESKEARLYIKCTTQQESTNIIKNWIADIDDIKKQENTNEETRYKNVVFIFYTSTDIPEPDKQRLRAKGISILNSKILDYFKELIKLYKNLAYYQFLSYLLNGKPIKTFSLSDLEAPAIRCKYSSKEYCYLFGIQPSKLIPLASVLHRKMDLEGDISENYQGLVQSKKIKEIKKFITEERGVFPTNIIISFETKSDNFFKPQGAKINDIQFGMLTLPRQYQSITVIDGQHRLFAYDGLGEGEKDLIYVVAFHKMLPEKQIQTFININEKQTKVTASLMWDLYPSILESSNIKAKISKLVKRLNNDKNSSLNGVIQYDSADYSKKGSKITLESICTAIKLENLFSIIEGILSKNEIRQKQDEIIYNLFRDYFNSIAKLNPEHWERNEKTKNLLRSNQGIGAYLKLFKELLKYIDSKNSFSTIAKINDIKLSYSKLLTPVNELIKSLKTTEEIKKFKRIGEGGKQQIFIDFVKAINFKYTDFGGVIIEKLENDELEEKRSVLLDNGENNTLEAKESFFTNTKKYHATNELEKNKDEAIWGIIKTVVGFSNYKGGDIILGLNDPQFDYIGLDNTDLKLYKDWDKLKQAIGQKIESETEGLTRKPEIIKITHNSKTFGIIRVKALDKKRFEDQDLVLLKHDNNCYKRENGDTLIIKTNDIKKYCGMVLKEMEEDEMEE